MKVTLGNDIVGGQKPGHRAQLGRGIFLSQNVHAAWSRRAGAPDLARAAASVRRVHPQRTKEQSSMTPTAGDAPIH